MSLRTPSSTSLHKRFVPLYLAAFLQGMWLWVPVEKLFMSEIGFEAATVGIMAAVYSAATPLIEVPSGILADRWSRRGVLVVASIAAMLSTLIGGLSTNVLTYFISAVVLAVYFATRSGTLEAVVYDTVLEETGDSERFESHVGRVRVIESAALVTSALGGGALASLTTPRLTYFLTVPFMALAIVAILRFKEPQLHKAGDSTTLRSHLQVTYQTITRRGQLRAIIALAVLASLVTVTIIEFGPLWLVALAASAAVYGPHWAGLMSTFGLGSMLATRLRFDRWPTVTAVSGLTVLSSLALTTSRSIVVVTLAQIMLVLLMATASVHVTRLLHDAVPSAIRAGVASGVGAVSWIVFLPFALVFGLVSQRYGVHVAGWMITGVAVLASGLMMRLALGHRTAVDAVPETVAAPDPAVGPVRGCLAEATA